MAQPKPPPILDISAFYAGDREAREELVQEVKKCCLNNGFFQITGHQIPGELQNRAMRCAKEFFALPLEEKRKIDRKATTMSEPGTSPDIKEGLFIGPEMSEDHPYCMQRKLNSGPNAWPAPSASSAFDAEEFRRSSMEYYNALFELAKDIFEILALTMDYNGDFFAPLTDGALTMLRYLHYPPQPVNGKAEKERGKDKEKGTGAHRDYSCITLLLQDDVGGLEVLDEESQVWLNVKPTPSAYVVNLGNTFSKLTNENYKSALHRVINKSGRERYSIPFFFTGNPDYVCEYLPAFRGLDEPVRYPPATVHEVVGAALRGTVQRAKEYHASNGQ
ncbi:Fe(2+)/2-oxoglutarate-dependent oxygenase encD [Aspergillus undulatus]|uniref:Fe(2+)/2-oxoglutarate-dependent oxygenase encD n=1 Tax=Aspergillus undulatus TaxID=1810928 RepID=UPI003CCD02A1